MKFDLTVTLGNLLTLIGTLASLGFVAWRLFYRLQQMQWKLNMIWKWYKKEHHIDNGDNDSC